MLFIILRENQWLNVKTFKSKVCQSLIKKYQKSD